MRDMRDCLPLQSWPDDGVFDEVAVRVSVDQNGHTHATTRPGGVKRRIDERADSCILDLINSQRFPPADCSVEISMTVALD